MKTESEILISQLVLETTKIIDFATQLKLLLDSELNKRIDENSWSILECLEHLNLYGDFYLLEIYNKMNQSKIPQQKYFKSGILGNYFAKSMIPKENLNKMKTLKMMNPIFTNRNKNVIDIFINQQNEILNLLEIAKSKNLEKIKTNISISKLIKIRLGDTFRFIINHNLRHIQQIRNIQNA